MMRTLGILFGKYKAAIAVAVLVAALTLMLYVRGQQLRTTEALLKARTAELALLGDKVKTQNEAVTALEVKSKAQASEAIAAGKKSAAALAASQARLEALAKERAKVPTDCKGVLDWMREKAVQGAGWGDQ